MLKSVYAVIEDIVMAIKLLLFTFMLLCVLPVSFAENQQVTITWTPNTEPDLAGYRLYQMTGDKIYPTLDVANAVAEVNAASQLSVTLTVNIEKSKRYWWCVTAYDDQGRQSKPSRPVSKIFKSTKSVMNIR